MKENPAFRAGLQRLLLFFANLNIVAKLQLFPGTERILIAPVTAVFDTTAVPCFLCASRRFCLIVR